MLATQYTHVLKIHETGDFLLDQSYHDLHVTHFTVNQKLSACYQVTLDVTTRWMQVPTSLIGKRASFTWQRRGASQTVRGVVDKVELLGTGKGVLSVRVTLVPRLFMATRDRRDRVFNDLNAHEIIDTVLGQILGPFGDAYKIKSDVTFLRREICIQYQESTFDFLLRILAEEGLHFTFDHAEDQEVIVFGTSNNMFSEAASGSLLYRPHAATDASHISHLQSKTQTPGPVAQVSCLDWRVDSTYDALEEHSRHGAALAPANFVYITHHTPHGPHTSSDAKVQHLRLNHEMRAVSDGNMIGGETNCLTLSAGTYFRLAQHPDSALERVYLVTSCEHTGRLSEVPQAISKDAQHDPYKNVFEAISFDTPFRTPFVERNSIASLHTGIVIAPPGEDIDTDEHGRIQVLFRWDKESARSGQASAWLRYNQVFAGSNHGLMAVPRAGTEVLIGFINGHIDHPVVLGSVYGQGQMQPYNPQTHKSRTTLRTYTTPRDVKEDTYNELTFEDTDGQQCVAIHAAKDYSTRVKGRHIDILADDAKFRPLASKSMDLTDDAELEDYARDKSLQQKHDPYQGNRVESFVGSVENTAHPLLYGINHVEETVAHNALAGPMTSAYSEIFSRYRALRNVEIPFTHEGADALLPTEHLQHVLEKLAAQAIANHARDKIARTYAKPRIDKTKAKVKQGARGFIYRKTLLNKDSLKLHKQVKSIDNAVSAFSSLREMGFEYPRKFEEKTRSVFAKEAKRLFDNGQHTVRGLLDKWKTTDVRILMLWFPMILRIPGASALWKRLTFTEGGALSITTKDHREVILKKRITHVGGESSDVVYDDRFTQTSGQHEDIVLGHVQQRFGAELRRMVSGSVVQEGREDLSAKYGGSIFFVAGSEYNLHARHRTTLHSDAETEIGAGSSIKMRAEKNLDAGAQENLSATAGKHLTLSANETLTIKQGKTIITMTNGKVEIKARDVAFEAHDVSFKVDRFSVVAKDKVHIKGATVKID